MLTPKTPDFYSTSAVLSPRCILTPKSSREIAEALTVVRATGTNFAVRGGGHMPIAGAASTKDGVLFALSNLNSCELIVSNGERLVRIGSGQRWIDVYNCLAPHKLLAIGGRFA
jgi:FAD/FMN-containing dehydrogenase